MPQTPIRICLPTVPQSATGVTGELVNWRQGRYYRIIGYDAMNPFLVSVMSHSDLWMYVSSNGGLTAGRRDAEHSLFPYETVDKLHVSHTHTGPRTVIRCLGERETLIWQPFSDDGRMRYQIERSIYKHALGCELWFEETNSSLGLTFRYGWRPSDRFGWVRTAELLDRSSETRCLEILDGVQNILPAGIGRGLQDSLSCLVDAYKYAECDSRTMLALYGLCANIVDRPEASEALRVTVAWQTCFPDAATILNGTSWNKFIKGDDVAPQTDLKGQRGAYLLKGRIRLAGGESRAWHIILDTPVDQRGVVKLQNGLKGEASQDVETDIARGHEHLSRLLASADAFQTTGDPIASTHHTANVLFNIARGGVLPNQYLVDRDDLAGFLAARNRPAASRHAAWLAGLPASLPLAELRSRAEATADTDLGRLCDEYLPIVFSRRHGDPSRPWNQFSITTRNPDGSQRYTYQGNWRDIFQNWEALCRSFPECLESIIAKFINASTVDGFNPYRIMREGIDWEIADPAHPWSSIGYWGDHQIIYLLKFLEASHAHRPGRLAALLDQNRYCYADVPYNIRPYADIVGNPQNTVTFDWRRQKVIDSRVDATGTDGKLVHVGDRILHVNLAEKLLVPILAKISNLVPDGGIWMNTMRPEWNDANNALVGNGMSVVTACYLYRHLGFCADLFDAAGVGSFDLSSRVADWLTKIGAALDKHCSVAADDRRRRAFMDFVGQAFSKYRLRTYAGGPVERKAIRKDDIVGLLRQARRMVGATIRANRRADGLYHAYNILHLSADRAAISRLPPMLEGQVAVLSSGLLTPEEALALLRALRASALYREDQHSYLLYPVKSLPAFLKKNRVPDSMLDRCPTLAARFHAGDRRIVMRDEDGQLRFHPDLRNAQALRVRIEGIFPEVETRAIVDTYEEVFNHKAFTGRSGTMYGYEGIGCIYWHMVGKLLLAVQEVFERATAENTSDEVVEGLKECYFDVRGGLGFTKEPEVFGAFPLDPYSHTPGFAGAKQPGMTGQVKEEILTRWGELGVHVDSGRIRFNPWLLRDREWLTEAADFSCIDTSGGAQSIHLDTGSLAFTFCQTPIIYIRDSRPHIVIRSADGSERSIDGNTVDEAGSAEVFRRTGLIRQVTVYLPTT